jgi:LAO/AO transport system kinase
VLSAGGAQVVLIETVGVGQDELDVMQVAHTTLVVQAPGAGDDLQAAKAGLIECADVFVVNKADLPGADSAAQHLRGMLAVASATGGSSGGGGHAAHRLSQPERTGGAPDAWEIPVLSCIAQRDEGMAPLLDALQGHRAWLTGSALGQARRRARSHRELLALLRDRLGLLLLERHEDQIEQLAERVSRGELDPYAAVQTLLRTAGLG